MIEELLEGASSGIIQIVLGTIRGDQMWPAVDFGVKLIGKPAQYSFVGAILAETDDKGGQIAHKGEGRVSSGGIMIIE